MNRHQSGKQSFALSNLNHSEGWIPMIMLTMVLQNSMAYILSSLKREEGQDFAEYAIILALVVIVAAAAFGPLGDAISAAVGAVTTELGG